MNSWSLKRLPLEVCIVTLEGHSLVMCDYLQQLEGKCYSVYVLFLLLLSYTLCLLNRFVLAICTQAMAQEIGYGDKSCLTFENISKEIVGKNTCDSYSSSAEMCNNRTGTDNKTHICEYNYNGNGFEYQLIAGPIFIAGYALSAIPLGYVADVTTCNRKNLLAICVIFWSAMTLLTGFATDYWHVVLLRFGLGIGQAGCVPLGVSLITDYFAENIRGSALGIYNCGFNIGYGLAYAFGVVFTNADIAGQGWRWSFYLSAIPGLVLCVLIILTIREPEKMVNNAEYENEGNKHACRKCFSSSLLLIFTAGSVRSGAGYVWNCNTQVFYNKYFPKVNTALWISWIPSVSGTIGMWFGGFVSDRCVQDKDPTARIRVVMYSLLLAAPFAACSLCLNSPWTFISQIPCNILGDMWVGITIAVVVELVPSTFRTTAVAFYLLSVTCIGGSLPIIVPPIQQMSSLRITLFLLYPGCYLIGAFVFLLSLLVIHRDVEMIKHTELDEEAGPFNKDKEDTRITEYGATEMRNI